MNIEIERWPIRNLIHQKDRINPKPQYQRTPVWNTQKKKLLIDSILREYDLPKFYLRETPNAALYDFEVTDGQQRIRTIWEFYENKIKLAPLELGGISLEGMTFEQLPEELKKTFLCFQLSFAVIKKASNEEINILFTRLQMGSSLIPAELRHATASSIGVAIQSIIENHNFFEKDCKIPNVRYKHQDYIDHVMALMHFKNKRNLKAPILKQLYEDLAYSPKEEYSEYIRNTMKILDWMYSINGYAKGIFRNKWGFVDTFWFLYKNLNRVESINYKKFAEAFKRFEMKRKRYNKEPEKLIENRESRVYDKEMYHYILAFKTQGGEKNNIKTRDRVFENHFNKRSIIRMKNE